MSSPTTKKRRALDPADSKWLVDDTRGEQGYYDESDQWVSTGWTDSEGYWFEACGEFDRTGKWEGTGSFDVFDPDGEWYETGHFDENDEWVKADGVYENNGTMAFDLEKELQRTGPRMEPAPLWKPQPKGKLAAASGKGSGPKKMSHSEKYALKQARKTAGSGAAGPWVPKEDGDGRLLRVAGYADPAAVTVWNDAQWAAAFAAVVVGTVVLAVSKNIQEEVVLVVDACTASPCLNGATCSVASGAAADALRTESGYICECATGFVGPECQIMLASVINVTKVVTSVQVAAPKMGFEHIASLVGVLAGAAAVGVVWAIAWMVLLQV